ncbi:MAG: insulinase family protein [Kiritimatiellae bacterium]|nr:insulinase family protein [Kiritimatiellia bacterium]
MTGPEHVILDNGMSAILVPCEAESAAAGVFVANGSRYENAKEAGVSHFIEHMLFKGTAKRKPADITRAIEGRGGNFNAFTGEETTCYFAHLPGEYLPEAVDILGDMYSNASLDPKEFEREKNVVIEEIRMYSDEPDAVAAENLQKNIFPGSPLGRPVAGNIGALSAMTADFMRDYIARHYRSSNTLLVISGSFDRKKALAAAEKAFAWHGCPGKAALKCKPADFSKKPIPRETVEKDVNQVQTAVGYRTFGLRDPRKYAMTVLDAILGRGMSSRLFIEVREKRALGYDISSQQHFFSDAGLFFVTVGTDPSKAERAIETIDREIAKICGKRPGAKELARVKEFLVGNFKLSHENVKSKMFFYGSTWMAFGRIVSPAEQVEGIKAVSADDVLAVANDVFVPGGRSVSLVVPRKR